VLIRIRDLSFSRLIAWDGSRVRAAPAMCIRNITRSADHQLAIAIEDE